MWKAYMIARHARLGKLSGPCGWMSRVRRFASDTEKVALKDLRAGKDLIRVDGKISEILELNKRHQGRGAAPVILMLRDLTDGNKFSVRTNSDAVFDKLRLESKRATVMYRDGDGNLVFFLDEGEMEEFTVSPNSLSPLKQALLIDGVSCALRICEGKLLDVDLGEAFEVTVEDAGPDVASRGSAAYKTLSLPNGLKVPKAPSHVKTGDVILVHINGDVLEFVSKKAGYI